MGSLYDEENAAPTMGGLETATAQVLTGTFSSATNVGLALGSAFIPAAGGGDAIAEPHGPASCEPAPELLAAKALSPARSSPVG